MPDKYRLTLIQPCIGRREGQTPERYMRTWQMEPLSVALIAGLTPDDVEISFFDDRLEAIDYERPTDLVAISVETYTAKRAYQIASVYRRKGIPVVMGGFHATLAPQEVARFAETVVVGEAEELWGEVIDDYRHGTPKPMYRSSKRADLGRVRPDRSVYGDRSYLPVGLVETGRGCEFSCDFCAIQSAFSSSYRRRPIDDIVSELREMKARGRSKLFFFVDDNFIAHPREAKEILRAIAPLGIRWVSQASINVAHDEELLELLTRSGCQGLLIGFESLNPDNLVQMNKTFNTARGGFEKALANLRRHRIRLYVTFMFGYDHDTPDTFPKVLEFAQQHAFFISAFNHVTPFPGTPLFARLQEEGRLLHEAWWLDPNYSYSEIPFTPKNFTTQELQQHCVATRRAFYGWPSILRRGFDAVNRSDLRMFGAFFGINLMHQRDVADRVFHPLGDRNFTGPLLEVQ